MARGQIQYEVNSSLGWLTTPIIYYETTYNSTKNETTINFYQKAHFNVSIKDSGYCSIYTSIYITTDGGSGGTGWSEISVYGEGSDNSIVQFTKFPSPQTVVVKHSSTQGKKTVKIRAVTDCTSTYFGSDEGSVTVTVGEYTYGIVGAPEAVTVTVTDSTLTNSVYNCYRDATVTLSWSKAANGDNNPVKGYKIYYNSTGGNYTLEVGSEVTYYQFKISNSFNKPKKGETINLKIQALATYGDLNSSIISANYGIKIINKKPAILDFTTQGIIRINTDANNQPYQSKIEIHSLQVEEVDGDEIEYYYKTENKNKNIGTPETKLEGSYVQMIKDFPYLFVKAKEKSGEKLESDWFGVKVPVNTVPSFNFNYTINDSDKALSVDKSKTYVNIISNLKCSFSNQTALPVSYVWNIGTSSNKNITYSSERINQVRINPIDISKGGGEKVAISLKIIDSAEDEFVHEIELNERRLQKRIPDSIEVFPQVENDTVNPKYLSHEIKFKIKTTQPQDEVKRRFKIYLLSRLDSVTTWTERELSESFDIKDGLQIYNNYYPGLEDNKAYRFKLVSTDVFNNNAGELITPEDKPYYLLGVFNAATFNFNQTEWHPIKQYIDNKDTSKGDFITSFTTQYSDDVFENPENGKGIGRNFYTIKAIIGNTEQIIMEDALSIDNFDGGETIINGQTIVFYFKNLTLFKKLKIASDSKTEKITFKLIPYNGFKREGTPRYFETTLVLQEKPEFRMFNGQSPHLEPIINSNAKDEYKIWFNPSDSLNLNIKATPFDYNDLYIDSEGREINIKTILKYQLAYKYLEDGARWITLQEGSLLKENALGEGYEYIDQIYLSSLPNLSKNNQATNIIFGLRIIDENGIYSDFLETALVACRKSNPVFDIVSASLKEEVLNINLSSNDLGGNDFSVENFQRSGEEKFEVLIQTSEDNTTFTEYVVVKQEYNNFLNFSFNCTKNFTEDWKKVYIKAKIIIETNSVTKETIEVETDSFLLSLLAPTMSHRAQWVGINTSENNEEEVFHVAQFSNKKYVKLSGFNFNTGKTREILIDLSTGNFYNAVIDGGTWDENGTIQEVSEF